MPVRSLSVRAMFVSWLTLIPGETASFQDYQLMKITLDSSELL